MDGMGSVSAQGETLRSVQTTPRPESATEGTRGGRVLRARPGLDEIGQLVPQLASTAENTCQATRAFAVKLRMM